MSQSIINAHAAVLGVASDAGADGTPPDATRHCCGDFSACARHASDPPEAAAARRVEIEAARDCLEAAVSEYIAAPLNVTLAFSEFAPIFDRIIAAGLVLERLRKGAT